MKRPTSDIASAINPDSVLVIDEAMAREQTEQRSEEEEALLALIDGKRTVAEILHQSRMSGFVAMRRLRALLERKAIRPVGRLVSPPASNGGGQKVGRLGLTQDLTSAAKAFSMNAPSKRPATPAGGAPTGAGAAAEPDANTRLAKAPTLPGAGEQRTTPLQGSIALPSVIIAFGPEFSDARRAPTRRLASPEAVVATQPPPAAPPVQEVKPPEASALVPTAPPAQRTLAPTTHQETSIIPRVTTRSRVRRHTPQTEEIQAQELWLSVTRRDWQTLAVVSTHSNGAALIIATALAEAGSVLRGKPVELFVAEDGDTGHTGEWHWNGRLTRPVSLPSGGLPAASEKFERVVALEPLASNPRGVTIAQSAEAVLMVAETGITDLRSARRAVEMIGRDRFLGCVLVDAPHR